MARIIKERVITLNELITQCNLVVKNMINERTTTADNRRILIFNCALALRQMQDTLTQVEQERDALKAQLQHHQPPDYQPPDYQPPDHQPPDHQLAPQSAQSTQED